MITLLYYERLDNMNINEEINDIIDIMEFGNSQGLLTESVRGTMGVMSRKLSDLTAVVKKWHGKKGQRNHSKFESSNVSDDDFKIIQDSFNGMKASDKYSDYKKHFLTMCTKCHIQPNGCIIQKYKLTRGKDNKNYVYVKYTTNKVKVAVPNGCRLFHRSTIGGIKELNPAFKGKAAKGYFYDAPRIYLSIRKEMPKICADIKQKENTHMYMVRENIRTAYVDPLISMYFHGAVYIETNLPVKVDEVSMGTSKPIKEDVDFGDDPSFASLEEFMEYYGLVEIEDDVYEETVKSKLGEYIRSLRDTDLIKKSWNKLASGFKHSESSKLVTDEKVLKQLKEDYLVLRKEPNYSKYKKSFDNMCKFFALPTNETIIENVDFIRKNDGVEVKLRYSSGRKRIMIPNGTCLLHVSPVAGIKELEPTFKSKTEGKYMYPSKRVYFTLGRKVKSNKAGLEKQKKSYKYTPKENVQTAYIDPALANYKVGAVYIDTSFPVPVEDYDTKMAKLQNIKESITNDDVLNAKLIVYEKEANGEITKEQMYQLLEMVDELAE